MRRIFIGLLLLTWMATGAAPRLRAATIDVEIGSDSDRAAVVLLEELNKKGSEQNLSFRLNKDEFTIKFIITWRRGGPGYKSPWARVDVYNADGMPLFSVDREGRAFTRRGAVGRCAQEIVKLLPSHLPQQTSSRRDARPLAARLPGCEGIRDCHQAASPEPLIATGSLKPRLAVPGFLPWARRLTNNPPWARARLSAG